jgi:hypothetical protein
MDAPASAVSDAAASILADAAALEAGAVAAPGQPAAPEIDPEQLAGQAAADAVNMVAALVLPLVAFRFGPAVAAAYGRAELGAIGKALAALAVKRRWRLDQLDKLPELALAAALAGPALPFALAELQRRQAGGDRPKPETAPAELPQAAPAPASSAGWDR